MTGRVKEDCEEEEHVVVSFRFISSVPQYHLIIKGVFLHVAAGTGTAGKKRFPHFRNMGSS